MKFRASFRHIFAPIATNQKHSLGHLHSFCLIEIVNFLKQRDNLGVQLAVRVFSPDKVSVTITTNLLLVVRVYWHLTYQSLHICWVRKLPVLSVCNVFVCSWTNLIVRS